MARLLAACNSVSYLIFSMIGIPNVERWGRRKMIMFAAAGQCFCYLIITILIYLNEDPGYAHQHQVASASVAFFFLYYVFFGIGLQVSLNVLELSSSNTDHITGSTMAIPYRDQLIGHENQRCRSRYCDQLDLQVSVTQAAQILNTNVCQLHGRRNHT